MFNKVKIRKMKTKLVTYAFLLIFIISSCEKSSTDPVINTNLTFKANLNGASEVPVNASTATGTATFTYNTTTYVLSGSVTFLGLTPTAAHIHKGATGVPGGVIFPLGSAPLTSPLSFTSAPLDATQRADLMANLYYVNIHSAAFTDGEIRGQLIQQAAGINGGGGDGGGGSY